MIETAVSEGRRATAALVAVLAHAGAAIAAEPVAQAAGPTKAEPCRETDPGERLHDGFFARSEPGVAYLWEAVSDGGAAPRRSRSRGFGQSAGLSIGGTPVRGLVVGGTVWTARVDPVFVEGGRTVTPDDDSVKLTLLRIGPFVDFYPDPRRGLHLLFAASLAVQLESDQKGDPLEPAALGASVAAGAGYEWFVGSDLSLGILGRVALGSAARSARDGEETVRWMLPELALSATYH